ncbi:MAG: hypothetical protein ACW99G_19235 [Candidatus Thorarchaeota archaeon]|jgi:hypothetical protein
MKTFEEWVLENDPDLHEIWGKDDWKKMARNVAVAGGLAAAGMGLGGGGQQAPADSGVNAQPAAMQWRADDDTLAKFGVTGDQLDQHVNSYQQGHQDLLAAAQKAGISRQHASTMSPDQLVRLLQSKGVDVQAPQAVMPTGQ